MCCCDEVLYPRMWSIAPVHRDTVAFCDKKLLINSEFNHLEMLPLIHNMQCFYMFSGKGQGVDQRLTLGLILKLSHSICRPNLAWLIINSHTHQHTCLSSLYWRWCLFTSPGMSLLQYINRHTATRLDCLCSLFLNWCCYCINRANMWCRSRTHFPTDDIWKPSRLSWIKAGIKGFSPSLPWTGRELCTRRGKAVRLPRSWGHLAGVFSPHLPRMTENCLCTFRITSHCRWMITQKQYTELSVSICECVSVC